MRKKPMSLLLVIIMLFYITIPAAAVAGSFTDIPDNWSKAAIEAAISNGLLTGSGNRVRPDDDLMRSEMAAIVNRAFGAVQKGDISKFADVGTGKWYAEEMAKAVKMGTFTGDGSKLRPEEPITRQEAFTVLARAFKLSTKEYSSLDRFNDKGKISDWAKPGIAALVSAGYVNGNNGGLNPAGNITRAEFAQIMHNIVKTYIKSAGTYSSVSDGNVMINVPDVTLKGVTVKGDLIIGDGVGTGNVTLDAVKVEGRTVVRGGGKNSIHVINGSNITGTVIIDNVNNEVRIVTDQGTTVQKIEAGSQVVLEGKFGEVKVVGQPSGSTGNASVEVKGTVQTLTVEAKAEIKVTSGTVTNLGVAQAAAGTTINTAQGAKVETVVANAPTNVTGSGTVAKVDAKANDVKVETKGTTVTADQGVTGVTAGGNAVTGGATSTTPASTPAPISSGSSSSSSSSSSSEIVNPLTYGYTGDYTALAANGLTYGPSSGNVSVTGSVYVNDAGITLRNLTITGNLTLGSGIGNGEAYLNNVIVQGKTIIKGGGSNSIHILGTSTTGIIEVNDQRTDKSLPINIEANGTGTIAALNIKSQTPVKITARTDTIGFVAAVDKSMVTYADTSNKTALLNKIISKANYILDNSITGSNDSNYVLNTNIDSFVSDIIDVNDNFYKMYKLAYLKYYINPLIGVPGYESQYTTLENKLIAKQITYSVSEYRDHPHLFNSNMHNSWFPNPGDTTVLIDHDRFGANQTYITMEKEAYDRVIQLPGFSDPGNQILGKLQALQNISVVHSVYKADMDSSGSVTAGDKLIITFKRQLQPQGRQAFEQLTPSGGSFGTTPTYSWDTVTLTGMSGSFQGARCTITLGASPSNFSGQTLTINKNNIYSYAPPGSDPTVGWLTDWQPVFDVVIRLP